MARIHVHNSAFFAGHFDKHLMLIAIRGLALCNILARSAGRLSAIDPVGEPVNTFRKDGWRAVPDPVEIIVVGNPWEKLNLYVFIF